MKKTSKTGKSDRRAKRSKRRIETTQPRVNDPGATGLEGLMPPWPKPLAKAALRGLVGEFVDLVKPETEADKAALAFQFLAAFGNVVGQQAFVQIGDEKHYGNLFVVIVAKTSESQKGTSLRPVRDLFNEVDPQWRNHSLTEGLVTAAGLLAEVKGREGDDKRVLFAETEFGAVLHGAHKYPDLAKLLRQAWDSEILASRTRGEPVSVEGIHLSIIGHVTPDELRTGTKHLDLVNGFFSRFLWPVARRTELVPMPRPIDEKARSDLASRVAKSAEKARDAGEVALTGKATERWKKVYKRLATEDVPESVGAVASRAAPQVLRMALIYALLDGHREIRTYHLAAALAAWAYARQSALHLFAGPNRFAVRAFALLKRTPQGRLTKTKIRIAFGNRDSREVTAALELLRANNLITKTTKTTGGRRATIWTMVA